MQTAMTCARVGKRYQAPLTVSRSPWMSIAAARGANHAELDAALLEVVVLPLESSKNVPSPTPSTPTPNPTVEMLANLMALVLADAPWLLHRSCGQLASAVLCSLSARMPKYVPTPIPAAPIP